MFKVELENSESEKSKLQEIFKEQIDDLDSNLKKVINNLFF